MTSAEILPSWRDGATRQAILDFVQRVQDANVPERERVAVFDNDGTLWCEKPMQIQIGFILGRLATMADQDPALRERQPWKAAYEKDYAWLSGVIAKHYQGDDSDMKLLMAGMIQAFAGVSVEQYEAQATAFLHEQQHPTLQRPYVGCGYRPMVELLRYLEANGFTTYIASGGDRDFMRPATREMYGILREHVIGSTSAMEFKVDEHGNSVMYKAEMEFFDDGPVKPVRIWSRIGRRPILAGGNSNGDIQMLQFAEHADKPSLRLLLLHDDAEREFDYVGGAEKSLELAKAQNWTVISIKNDWQRVFA
jgi:hypothetical protein